MILNGEDVTAFIRTAEVGQGASDVGTFVPVRDKLVEMQQKIAEKISVVMDGRDIGTVVLPNAEVKLSSTPTLRKGQNADLRILNCRAEKKLSMK